MSACELEAEVTERHALLHTRNQDSHDLLVSVSVSVDVDIEVDIVYCVVLSVSVEVSAPPKQN